MREIRKFVVLFLVISVCMFHGPTFASAECLFPFAPQQINYDYTAPEFQAIFRGLNETVDRFFRDTTASNGVSSYGLAVVHRNRTIYTSGQTKTPFRCASITKTFTALGALLLRERGLLSLDDPVIKFLPTYSIVNPYGEHNTTLRELMAHVSGLPLQLCPFLQTCTDDEDEILKQISGMELVRPPWSNEPVYSNMGISLLGHAWEKATSPRVSWWDFLKENVVKPLGLINTGVNLTGVALAPNTDPFARQDLGWSSPAAQMYTTTDDLAKYLAFLITGDPPLISDASRLEWFRPTKLFSDGSRGYAMPWELSRLAPNISSEFIVTKGGNINGYLSYIAFHQSTQLGVAVLTVYNKPNLPGPDVLGNAILSALIPQVEILNDRNISQTYGGVYTCEASTGFASPVLNSTISVLGGTIIVSSNSSRGLLATIRVDLKILGGNPYTAGGANYALLIKNQTENSFWFGDGSFCLWFFGSLSSSPTLYSPNTPDSTYRDELKFNLATSSVTWPAVGANCSKS